MIDYNDLMQAVTVQDEPAVAKILDKLTTEELQDIRRYINELMAISGLILRYKSLTQ